LGVRSILQNSRLAEKQGEDAAKKVIYQTVSKVMKSDDMKEGLQSFIERRAAVFKGDDLFVPFGKRELYLLFRYKNT